MQELGQVGFQLGWLGFDHVKNIEEYGGLTHFFQGFLDPNRLNGIRGLADARRVDDPKLDALNVERLLDGIPRRARNFADNGPLFVEQGVE